jgi:hypothetical protein
MLLRFRHAFRAQPFLFLVERVEFFKGFFQRLPALSSLSLPLLAGRFNVFFNLTILALNSGNKSKLILRLFGLFFLSCF